MGYETIFWARQSQFIHELRVAVAVFVKLYKTGPKHMDWRGSLNTLCTIELLLQIGVGEKITEFHCLCAY